MRKKFPESFLFAAGLGEPLLNSDMVAVHEAMDALNRPRVAATNDSKVKCTDRLVNNH